jgi:hypothetical protein
MTGKNPGLSVKSVTAMGILLVLLLSFITYPFSFMVHAQTQPSEIRPLTILKSNNTVLDPRSDAGLTLSDGANVLNTEPTSDPSTDALNDPTSPISDSTTDSSSGTTSSDSNPDDATTGEVASSDGATTGEVASSDGATTGAIETEGNLSTTDEGPAKVESASATEPLVSAPPPAESGEASFGAEIGVSDHSSPSSTIPNAAVNDNSLTSNIMSGSAAEASAENPNAVVQPITPGDGQTVTLGDVSNSDGTSAQISLDKESYAPGDTAQVTLQDPDADIDPSVVNTVQIIVGASDSNPAGTTVTLTETAANSGNFVGTFDVPTAGDKVKVSYDASRPQARVVINGVSQGGAVEVNELPVNSFQTSLGEAQPDVLIGNGIQVSLVDGAELSSNSDCGLLPPENSDCGGNTIVTLSYANSPLNNQQPSSFTVWQHIPGVGWVDLSQVPDCIDCSVEVHEDTKTVTANSPFGPGVFVVGVNTGGSGGGGGGAGFPGSGLVLDLIAPIVASEPPTPTPEPPSTSTDSTTGLLDTAASNTEDDTTSPSAAGTELPTSGTNTTLSPGPESGNVGGEVKQDAGSPAISSNGISTISIPGAGNVTVSYTNLLSERTLTVSALKDSDLSGFITIKDTNEEGILMTLDNTPYRLAGTVFIIGPTDSEFRGTVTVTLPYNASMAPQQSDVRMLHYTGSGWEDVTTSPPADGKVVTGSLSSLGLVAPAVKSS